MRKLYKVSDALKEHLLEPKTITKLEAMLLLGVLNLTGEISHLKKQGWIIQKRKVPFVRVLRRLNEIVKVEVPKNLPTKSMMITEYWLSKWGYDEQS